MCAPRATLGRCVTWMLMSAKTHHACTRASVSTSAAASNASVALDTQVLFFLFLTPPLTWRSIRESQNAYRSSGGWSLLRQPRCRTDSESKKKKERDESKAPPHNGWLLISAPASGRYRAGFSAQLTRDKFTSLV